MTQKSKAINPQPTQRKEETLGESHGYPKTEAQMEAPNDDTVPEQVAESNLKQDRKRKRKTKRKRKPKSILGAATHELKRRKTKHTEKAIEEIKTQEVLGQDRGSTSVEAVTDTVNAFQRVTTEEVDLVDDRLQDNSHWAKDGADFRYGAKAQEFLGKVRGSSNMDTAWEVHATAKIRSKRVAESSSKEATDVVVSCSFEDVDHVKFDGVNNLYYINRCQSPQEAQSMTYELDLLRFQFKIFPNFRKLSDVYIAVEERGTSLRRFLNGPAKRIGFFFGPSLLKYRGILIDLIEAYRHLMDTQIKCILTLDSVFISILRGGDLLVTVTRFASRGAADVVDAKSEWSEFAAFVESINSECGYPNVNTERMQRVQISPPMNDFLSCLRQQNDKWSLDDICKMPLFWDSTQKVETFCELVDLWNDKKKTDRIDCSSITLPHNWQEVCADNDRKLSKFLGGKTTIDDPGITPAKEFAICLRNKIGHFGSTRSSNNYWPSSKEETIRRIEVIFPNLMPMLFNFAEDNGFMHLLPKEEKRLKNLSR